MCGLMSVPPASLVFNSTVNWPIRVHLHSTTDKILESESVTYLQDKYYNNIYNHLSMNVFFDSCNLSIPYPLSINDTSNISYHCGLRECIRNDCLGHPSSENGLRRVNAFEHKNLLVYKELHNSQKLLVQVGNPRIWNSYIKQNKKEEKKQSEKRKKIYLTRSFANMYNIPIIKPK